MKTLKMLQEASTCISELETICGTLEYVIKNSFGPRSRSTLLSSTTGHVMLSTDGLTILSSLKLSHPIARIIVQSLDTFVSHNGDGCKTFILYLSSFIHAMRKEVDRHSGVLSRPDSEAFMRSRLSKCLLSFMGVDLPVIIDNMMKSMVLNMEEDLRSYEIRNIIFPVIKTVLNGTLPDDNTLNHLSTVITEYLTGDCVNISDVRNLCDWFDNSIFLIPNQPYSSSQIINGVLLTSRFFSEKTSLPLCDAKLICLQCPLDGSVGEVDSSIVQLHSPDLLVYHRHSVIEQFLLQLQSMSVSLIISVSKVSDFCLQRCQEANISVIDCVEESDLMWICNVCNKYPVTSVNDQIKAVNIIKIAHCNKVTIGLKSYVKLVLGDCYCHPKSIVLCAPSQGICQQLKIKIKRCVKVVSRLFDNVRSVPDDSLKSKSLIKNLYSNTIAGNGYFDMLLCDHLCYYCAKVSSPDIQMCCSLIQKILMAVPNILHGSSPDTGTYVQSNHQESNSSAFLNLPWKWKINSLDYVNSSAIRWRHQGRNSRGIFENGVMEVLSVKIGLVYSALSIAVNLIRMDRILGVKGRNDDSSPERGPDKT